jgi:hypothetical protein
MNSKVEHIQIMMDNSGILLKENGSENVKNILANGNDEK